MLTEHGIEQFNELVYNLRRDLSGTFASKDGSIWWYGDVLQELGLMMGYVVTGYINNIDSKKSCPHCEMGDENALD